MLIREYLIGVTAAGLICAIVKVLLPGKGTAAAVIKTLLGLLMILAVVHLWTSVSADGMFEWTEDISSDAQSIVSSAELSTKEAMRERIKREAQAYILAKAESLGAQLEVSVEVSDEVLAVPLCVTLTGAVSPYARQVISGMIADDLGIDREAQQWIS